MSGQLGKSLPRGGFIVTCFEFHVCKYRGAVLLSLSSRLQLLYVCRESRRTSATHRGSTVAPFNSPTHSARYCNKMRRENPEEFMRETVRLWESARVLELISWNSSASRACATKSSLKIIAHSAIKMINCTMCCTRAI